MRKRLESFIIGVLVALLSVKAYASSPGTTTASFLKIGIGARASAMGGAFTAIANDGTALYWNPAGLAQLERGNLSATYNLWLQEISQGYLSLAFPSLRGILGVGANYVDMGTLEGRDEYGNPTGNFSALDIHACIGYANRVYKGLMFGITVGALQDTIKQDSENAYLGSVGVLLRPESVLSLAAVTQNIGSRLGDDPLPLTYRAGIALHLGALILAADAAKLKDEDLYYCAGMEWWIGNILALRVGYKTNQDIGSGTTAGIGLKAGKIQIDYAYIPYGDLGNTHRVSLGIKF